ncbi:MAPEG family protein [Massilia sp. PAMC28688]|uniref:MAPEG family protein n=1 Tax=Massilia sp. PAMC28688 TaxID=2861283 RepID=UPI001C62A69C|nr:MAPEG family protein [Massilia sp. PAMC28688]QYF94959.1 MAPEG family protein [Massilia sp. PAMC28688]
MEHELTILGWTLVLALVQILLAAAMRDAETGLAYNMGPRDGEAPPMRPITGRLQRAQNNLLETLPLFAAAVLAAHALDRTGGTTLLGAQIYLAARVLYVPLYAFGVPLVRSLVWLASIGGLLLVIKAILF